MSRTNLAIKILEQGYPVVQENFSSITMVNSLIDLIDAIESGRKLKEVSGKTEDLLDFTEQPVITKEQAVNVLVDNLRKDVDYHSLWKNFVVHAIVDECRVQYFENNNENMDKETLDITKSIAEGCAKRIVDNIFLVNTETFKK